MAYYNKIGLLVLNEDQTKFLVCEKYPQFVTSDYIMPGGKLEEASEIECLRNEIREELQCTIDETSLEFINEYIDVAAGRPDRDVSIKLYRGKIFGEPTPSTEIKAVHWIGKEDLENSRISPIIRNKIMPDLLQKEILK
jgi:8-oxo-dGTP pyrophosphatase MutT (NUDIX family)